MVSGQLAFARLSKQQTGWYGWMGGLEEWVDGWIGYGWVSGMGGLVEWVDGLFIHGYRNGKVVL